MNRDKIGTQTMSEKCYSQQANKEFRKFERKYRDCIERNVDKIGTQTCYDISL